TLSRCRSSTPPAPGALSGSDRTFEFAAAHLRPAGDTLLPRLAIEIASRRRASRSRTARSPALGLGLRRLATRLFGLGAAKILLVLPRALLVRGSRFAERDGDRLPWVLDLLAASSRAQLAVLELVHDPSDRLFLRLGLLRRHGDDPLDRNPSRRESAPRLKNNTNCGAGFRQGHAPQSYNTSC